ncbi:YcgJ family protein [Klebsiella michiganensis]|uniref:YcgJ family protein n=1 Tax=Klebsiella michiganensis TaxID=1134687 RepID=UPI003F4FB55A
MRGGRRLFGPRKGRCRLPRGLLPGAGLVCLFLPGLVSLWGALFPLTYPAPGVVCDRPGGFCADARGLSVTRTSRRLGARSAGLLAFRLRRGLPAGRWQASTGLTCDSGQERCWTDPGLRRPDEQVAAQLWPVRGPEAAMIKPGRHDEKNQNTLPGGGSGT